MQGSLQYVLGGNALPPTIQPWRLLPADRWEELAALYLEDVTLPSQIEVCYVRITVSCSSLQRSYRAVILLVKNHEIPGQHVLQHNKQIEVEFPCMQVLIQPG